MSLLESSYRRKICLNGLWDFSADGADLEHIPSQWDTVPIRVPSPYNINGFNPSHMRKYGEDEVYVQGGDFRLYPEYPASWDRAKCGFYRRMIDIDPDMIGQRIIIRFDAAAFHCVFYLNGSRVKETMEAFLPIEIDVTSLVHEGPNEIVVACENSGYLVYKGRNGRNRLDYPRGSFFGEYVAGLWQDVWLITRPVSCIDDLFVVTDVETRKMHVTLTGLDCDGCAVDLSLSKWNKSGVERVIGTDVSPDSSFDWSWDDGEIELWDIGQPALYVLTATLRRGKEVLDRKSVRFGFRTMRAEGERIILNGRPVKLKIDAWHYLGYSVQTEAYARSYYRMAFDAGVNIVRLHAEPFPEFFIDIADEMGMLIVSESAVWASHCMFSYSPEFFGHCKEHLVRMILRDRNHPSVVMWSPENECIPAYMFCGSDYIGTIPELEEAVYDFLKVIYDYDTSRLVSCDGSGDLGGRLPVNSIHYPHYDCPTKRGKPILIGEMGSMYYSTPETVTKEYGRGALDSFDGRLEAVAAEAFHDLTGERKWASQICVFNLVWYGLEPLPFSDRALSYPDERTPGIKPSRVTPYLRTLNAGGDPALPEYIPNPVFRAAKDAYLDERTFLEHFPGAVYANEETVFNVTAFSDRREDTDYLIVAVWIDAGGLQEVQKPLRLPAVSYEELSFPFVPSVVGRGTLEISMIRDGEVIHTEKKTAAVIDRQEYRKLVDKGILIKDTKTGKALIDCDPGAPYDEFLHSSTLQHYFIPGKWDEPFVFPDAVPCRIFDPVLSFGAVPILTDGSGNAVALSLMSCGERQILCGLDLTRDDAVSAQILKYLDSYAQKAAVTKPQKPYLLDSREGRLGALLGEFGCEYERVSEDMLGRPGSMDPERLLIVDGSAFAHPEWLSGKAARRVLYVVGDKLPGLFQNTYALSSRRQYHLKAAPEAETRFGLSSVALYGLESGQTTVLCPKTLVHKTGMDDILLGVPDINWMCWNHVGEPIKTVAVRRSEKEDRSRLSALSKFIYAGSEILLSTLNTDTDLPKVRNIWARILSSLSVPLEARSNDEMTRLLSGSMSGTRVKKMLSKTYLPDEDPASLVPLLNRVENGDAWVIEDLKSKDHKEGRVYAFYVDSPSDRTDLLQNPDYYDMDVKADCDGTVLINGQVVARGQSQRITGVPLAAGSNLVVVVLPGVSKMPEITFERVKKPEMDLSLSLTPGRLSPVSLEGTGWFGSVNDTYASHAHL